VYSCVDLGSITRFSRVRGMLTARNENTVEFLRIKGEILSANMLTRTDLLISTSLSRSLHFKATVIGQNLIAKNSAI